MADRVVFLRPDAERIARAVRTVEAGNRNGTPLRFARTVESSRDKVFRICTFTGAWSINSAKTVTFKYQTTTPNTVSVTNLFFPLPDNGTRDCAIAKDGTAWFLIQSRMEVVNAATAATLTSSALEFKTAPVVAFATAGTATFSVSVTTCSTAS